MRIDRAGKGWGLLLSSLGLLVMGLMVLWLKANPQGVQAGAGSVLLRMDYLPYLLAAFAEVLALQALLVRRQCDTVLLPLVMVLVSMGLVEIARLKPDLFAAQVRWLCISLLTVFLVLRFWPHIRQLLAYQYLLGIVCVVILGLPMLFGTEIGGSRNWLVFGPFSVQPSEFGKILILFFLAAYLSDHRRVLTLPSSRFGPLVLPPLRFIAPLICIWGAAVLMFVVERDLGSALLFFGMAVLMTYMATGSKTYVLLAMVFIGVAAAISYMAFGHVRVRFDIWLDPWKDPNGMGYQIVQSLFSFGTGGVWGTGFGFGHPGFIPEVHTDFIYAAIAEEWGLIGSLSVLLCYVLLAWRGVRLALACHEEREALLAAGVAVLLVLQAFIIIAGVTKFLPLTGITLPFVSYGGSSLVAGFMELGILLSLSLPAKNRERSAMCVPDWKLKRQALQAAAFMMAACAVLMTYVAYLSTWKATELAEHPLNARNAAAQSEILRGSILAADGTVLAVTRSDGTRVYPLGEEAAAVTGYNGERIGSAGLEAHRNRELLGLTADMSRLGPLRQLLQSDKGNDIVTTIDVACQQAAYEALEGSKGAAIVLDADTGAVLAMVSAPCYDPNSVESEWDGLQKAEGSPLLNRAVQGLYPPGSTIKPMVAAAALQDGTVTADETFDCTGRLDLGGGYTIRDYEGEVHGRLDLRQALAHSCNVAFGDIGLKLGGKKLGRAFEEFGFDREIGGEILMTKSHLPDFADLGKGDLAQTAIGQSSLLVTPMHMALLASAFAHQGSIMQPFLVQKVMGPGGTVMEFNRPVQWCQPVTPELAQQVHDFMETVVESGTGTAAAVRGVRVTGKTGTAENASGADHAWFIGTAELSGRTVAFAIIVENGGSGGRTAAPIARRLIQSLAG